MKNILVTSAILTGDGRTYIYNVGGKPTSIKTGEPYCNSQKLRLEILVILDAAYLYPLEETVDICVHPVEETL